MATKQRKPPVSERADFGLIGLAVMGENLARNIAQHGFTVAVFNRTTERTEKFLASHKRERRLIGARSLPELVGRLRRPRRVLMMVKAGAPVDELIARLLPLLEADDILIDGGNSHFLDTERRVRATATRGVLFVGAGISGGEEGALHGPSIMPGGAPQAWPGVRDVLQAIAAKVAGAPCCEWIGPGGAGHFVKMAHNGIEYGDMQLIGEAYALLAGALKMRPPALASVFARWNQGDLNSYLVEITADIFRRRDPDTGGFLVDKILDAAGQKSTGKWTCQSALDLGVPLPLITEAVYARALSDLKDERVLAAQLLKGPRAGYSGSRELFCRQLEQALYAAKICSYAQGFALLRAASDEYGWSLDLGGVAALWRGGCIIRAGFLNDIKRAYAETPRLPNLMLAPHFSAALAGAQTGWRRIVAESARLGIPTPAMSSALAYYDASRSARLPTNLLQAQRDYFGAHTYERTDKPRGQFFHTEWKRAKA